MRRAVLVAMVGTLAVTMVLGGAATAGAPKDQKLADKAVLKLKDVPLGFDQVDLSGEDPTLPCEGALLEANQLALDAPHASSGFQLPDTLQVGSFGVIQSNVSVLPNPRESKQILDAFQDEDPAEECLLSVFGEILNGPGITTEISVSSYAPELDDKGNKSVIKGGDEYAGFAVNVTRSQAGGQPQFMEGVVVLGRVGRGVAQLVALTTGVVPQDEVQDMVQLMVKRLSPAR